MKPGEGLRSQESQSPPSPSSHATSRPKIERGVTFSQKTYPTSQQLLSKILRIIEVEEGPTLGRKKSNRSNEGQSSECKCKKTKCLKMYCECFAVGKMCQGCGCVECHNILEFQEERALAIDEALERDPQLFQVGSQTRGGCICKKTGCLKKYCECFSSGVSCSSECKCLNCSNHTGV